MWSVLEFRHDGFIDFEWFLVSRSFLEVVDGALPKAMTLRFGTREAEYLLSQHACRTAQEPASVYSDRTLLSCPTSNVPVPDICV